VAKRFRFTIRNLLLATAWMSVFGGSFSMLRGVETYIENWPDAAQAATIMILVVLFFASPCIAICQLFGRTRIGVYYGLAIGTAIIVAVLIIGSQIE
jgi:hypothetical protein